MPNVMLGVLVVGSKRREDKIDIKMVVIDNLCKYRYFCQILKYACLGNQFKIPILDQVSFQIGKKNELKFPLLCESKI